MSISLDIDLLKRAYEYSHKGYTLLFSDKGIYASKDNKIVLLVEASKLLLLQ